MKHTSTPLPTARQAREAAGLSLDVAAKAGQVKPGTLRRSESRQNFTLTLARKLARAYNVPLDFFRARPTGDRKAGQVKAGGGATAPTRPAGGL